MDTMKSAARKVSEVVFPGIKMSFKHKMPRKSGKINIFYKICIYCFL